MIVEILNSIAKEVVDSPMTVVAEVVQFVVLIGIIWVVAFGFGKRRGFVVNMLSERKARIAERLTEAQGAEARLAASVETARQGEQAAAEEAARLMAEAEAGAKAAEEQSRAEADAEAQRILDRARTALDNERAQMQADLREQLVELVSQATRSIMNEKLTVAEQRARIEEAIVAGVKTASESGGPDKPKNAVQVSANPATSGGQ